MKYVVIVLFALGIGSIWFLAGCRLGCPHRDNYIVEKVFSNGEIFVMQKNDKLAVVPIGSKEDAEAIWPAYRVKTMVPMSYGNIFVESGPFLLTSSPGYEGQIIGGKRIYTVMR